MIQDHRTWIADNGDGTYMNPILYTDYSDPDACRVGDDYFMVASSFCNAPGPWCAGDAFQRFGELEGHQLCTGDDTGQPI